MKIAATFIGDGTRELAVIMFRPSWLARFFGAKERSGIAKRYRPSFGGERWVWEATGRYVGGDVLEAIETQEVGRFPRATARTTSGISPPS